MDLLSMPGCAGSKRLYGFIAYFTACTLLYLSFIANMQRTGKPSGSNRLKPIFTA